MSYSKVNKNGFPKIKNKEYLLAYHIVREADLLAAFNFDRAIIYSLLCTKQNIRDAYNITFDLFNKRMFKHMDDNLYITEYSKNIDSELRINANQQINNWKKILNIK